MRDNACRTAAVAVAVATAAVPALGGESNALVIHCGGLDALLVDERDKGLLTAIGMVDARLAELPGEIDDPDAEMGIPMLRVAWDLLTRPMTLQVGVDEDAEPNQGMPFYAQAFFEVGRRQRQSLAGRIANIIEMSGADPGEPVEGDEDVRVIDMRPMHLIYGPADRGYAVSLNKRTEAAAIPNPGLPPGVEPVIAFEYDGPAAQPFFGMLLAMMGPNGGMVGEMLDTWGITGPEASSFIAAIGYGADRTHASWRYTNYVPVAERLGFLVRAPLDRDAMSLIPRDVAYCEIGKYPMGSLAEWFENPQMLGVDREDADTDEIEAAMDEFAAKTGVHPIRDVLAHLGDTYGFYMSDSTGGGGLMSSVLFLETTDPAAMQASLDRLAATFNDAVADETRGYVRLRRSDHDGMPVTTLIFPGLPVPLEISWTVSGSYIFVGATPHALLGAVRQSSGRRPSLLDNAGFKAMGGGAWTDASYVNFIDVPRYARSGYGMLQLGCSALANAVRSPNNAVRDPGFICPSFHDLLDDAKPTVSIYGIKGDDLVGSAQGDRSTLVALASAAGFFMDSGAAIAGGALVAGATLPAMAKAQENAKAMKSAMQARTLAQALTVFEVEFGRMPRDWMELVEEGYLDADMLASPRGPVSDDRGDYWLNPNIKHLGDVMDPQLTVAIYDRAMFEQGGKVAVCFIDGHVETMDAWRLRQIAADEHNAGTDFDLP